MSELTPLNEALLADALDAAFEGDVPAVVRELVDLERCLADIGDGRLGFVFPSSGPARVRVELAGDEDRVRALVLRVWPDASTFFKTWADAPVHVETDGSLLRLFAIGIESAEEHGGAPVVGHTLTLPSGEASLITQHDAPPADGLSLSVLNGVEGAWFCLVPAGGGDAVPVFSSDAHGGELYQASSVVDLPPHGEATRGLLLSTGYRIGPLMVEQGSDGPTVCLWGLRAPSYLFEPAFVRGEGELNAVDFAASFRDGFPGSQREEALALLARPVWEGYRASAPDPTAADAHLVAAWRWLTSDMRATPLQDRLARLRQCAEGASVAGICRDAIQIAVAHYIATHDDADMPESIAVGKQWLDLDPAALQEAAGERLKVLEAVEADTETLSGWVMNDVDVDITVAKDTLGRVVEGIYLAAIGPLADYLNELGPGALDLDPAQAHLADVDLDADRDDEWPEQTPGGVPDGAWPDEGGGAPADADVDEGEWPDA